MKRRNFLKISASTGLLSAPLLVLPRRLPQTSETKKKVLTVGICADLHQDIIHDGPRRLQAFIDEMKRMQPDFIVQMGDFCTPKSANRIIMDIWDQFDGPKYHVIGNHDVDDGFTHDQVVAFWNAKGKYYSFDVNGYHFIVLNANERKPGDVSDSYPRSINEEQRIWLEKDIDSTPFPVIIFCHQGLDNDLGGVDEAIWVRTIFERANVKAGRLKVRLVFSGHHHQDYYNIYNDIHYVQINSMSYQWMGAKYVRKRYDDVIEKAHPTLKYTAPYAAPLWALLTVYADGAIAIKGRKTTFVSPTPDEMGRPPYHAGYPDVSWISDRQIKPT